MSPVLTADLSDLILKGDGLGDELSGISWVGGTWNAQYNLKSPDYLAPLPSALHDCQWLLSMIEPKTGDSDHQKHRFVELYGGL